MSEYPDHRDRDDHELDEKNDEVIGRALRWSLAVLGLLAVVGGLVWWALQNPPEPEQIREVEIQTPRELVQQGAGRLVVEFRDVTESAGIDFVHVNGATGEKLLPETMGAGAAFLDFDNDGDQDLLLVNSNQWPHSRDKGRAGRLALYENDGTGRFNDVAERVGLGISLYGMGVAVGDYDGDGLTDVFVSALGPNRLFRNRGGSFEEVTESAGVAGDPEAWSSSAGFFDMDADGDLDLFVCNYVKWSRQIDLDLNFTLNGRDRAYGPPNNFTGTHSYLYRNEGDGSFHDVSAEAGIEVNNPATGNPMGKALAVFFSDLDGDHLPEIFVANDTVQNFLFQNLGGGKFEEIGAFSGVGFDSHGNATGAMGIDGANFRNDGSFGIAVANFANEMTSLYVSQDDPLLFSDESSLEGIGAPSRLRLSFGVFFFDYDLDGRLDFFQANGHLEEEISQVQASQTYRQAAQLFWNSGEGGEGCYVEVPESEVGDLSRPIVGRGAAYADIDQDGDLDILVTQAGGRPMLLENTQQLGNSWLRVELEGRGLNRQGIGSWILARTGETVQRRLVSPTRSYLSQVELPVTLGLGQAELIDELVVEWPDGVRQVVGPVEQLNRTLVVRAEQ